MKQWKWLRNAFVAGALALVIGLSGCGGGGNTGTGTGGNTGTGTGGETVPTTTTP